MNTDRIRAAMTEVMGEFPDASRRVPLDVEVLEETRETALTRFKVAYTPEPGDRCFAWLLVPHSGASRMPGILALHQTTRIGKDEPAGLGGKPNLHYALELACRGYVVLAPDYAGFGEYTVDCYAMGYASATMKGIWNHVRALDLLQKLPEVNSQRLACIGHSLGGHNALFVSVFDERIRATVSSCGFTRFTWNNAEGRGEGGNLADWSHAGYMPRIRERYGCRAERVPFDFPDVLAVVAPRPLFINAPLGDSFQFQGVDECVELVRPLYTGAVADALTVLHPEGGHDFPPAVRAAAYNWLDTVLA